MTEPCAKRNPLVRSGMTQAGRVRAELATDHFLPDERDLADLVLFGQRYARHIQYYSADNAKAGDWSVFFDSDVTASLAALAKLPVDAFRGFQLDLETWLKDDHARAPAQLEAHAKLLFHLPLALLQMAAAQHARLPGDHPFTGTLVALAEHDLADPLTGLIAWYKGAISVPGAGNSIFADTAPALADYNTAGTPGDARVRLSSTIIGAIDWQEKFAAVPVPSLLLSRIAPGSWAGLYAATAADTSPYLDAIGAAHQRYEQIYDALNYNLLSTSVERIYQALERIRRDAVTHLQESLTAFAGHAPHYGLWLAFLQLFQHAKGELNQFTARHLDFYFRDVLKLQTRPAEPDKAHVLFELAKGQTAHLLKAGTLFRAGKDGLGRAMSYALENDFVVNRASVAELRGLLLHSGGTAAAPAQLPRAAWVVQSRDGLGEVDLAQDDPTWVPFGPAPSPAARVGFAIRDRKLFLREGTRTITLRAELDHAIATNITPHWIVRLTGDKGWFEVTGTAQIRTTLDNNYIEPVEEADEEEAERGRSKKPKKGQYTAKESAPQKGSRKQAPGRAAEERRSSAHTSNIRDTFDDEEGKEKDGGRPPRPNKPLPILEIAVTLDADDPPVVPFAAKLHGSEHAPGVPVIEVVFDFSDPTFAAGGSARAFAALRNIRAQRVTLATEAAGLKNLTVIAGGGNADVAKPFAPFGAQPATGAALVIGSSEIFSKPIADWALTLDWLTPYSDSGYFWHRSADSFNPSESVLSSGKWIPVDYQRARESRKYAQARRMVKRSRTDIALGETNAEVAMKGARLIDGLAEQTLENPPLDATSVNGFVRLRLPYNFGHAAFVRENTRALIDLAGGDGYTASTGVNTSSSLPREPYNPIITRIEASYTTTRDVVEGYTLLHPFGVARAASGRLFPDFPFEGALLIGVQDLAAPARLSLLIQVADGSGDPLKKAPALQFHYLDGDAWQAFEPQDIDDKTRNFTSSGVLGLNIPEEADRTHHLLPSGLHWLRISALQDAGALNRLLSITAQAARVLFVDAGNDPQRMATPLAAGTIAKLVEPDLAIKKITQPYSSFDGRPAEAARAFATRVSERLRHKDRAVTMWDYEALVLEAFPSLFRVKCLNTTELKRNAQNTIVADNELMPGAVTVVTVPYTHNQNARNPLRPYTDQATLTAVDAFLRKRLSPFVRLEVQNPKFEEVLVDFKVKFVPSIGDIAFYIDALNKAVIRFLTPWSQPGGAEITFGGKLWKSTIIDFVEERPEVDYITDFRLYHKVDIDAPAGGWSPVDVELVEATTARSILVSAACHTISEVTGNGNA